MQLNRARFNRTEFEKKILNKFGCRGFMHNSVRLASKTSGVNVAWILLKFKNNTI
jgi:hypothetical protein